jgi:hypothetical protein
MFLSEAGFADLKANNLRQHILNTAGKSYNVDGEAVINVLAEAKYGPVKEANDVKKAKMKIAYENGTPANYAFDGIVYQEIDNPKPEIKEAQAEIHPEIAGVAKSLESARGSAAFIFGDSVVNAGADQVKRTLAGFGFRNAQISVADNDSKNIYYAVSLGTAGMKVPVAIKNGHAMPPTIAIAAGEIYELSAAGVKKVLSSDKKDIRMMGVASPCYNLKPSELITNIKEAMDSENFAKAEDALSALAASEDSDAYKAGLAVYMNKLGMQNGLTKQAAKLEEKIETPILIDYKCFL